MVRLRLRRVGRKNQGSFRLVAADRESPRDGRYIEVLGFYNPRTEPATIELKEDRIYEWMSKGAQPSDSVVQVMTVAGTLERYERFKQGEDVAKLVEEAKAAEEKRGPSPKTRYPAPEKSEKKPAKAEVEAAAEPAEEAKAEKPAEEPKAEEAKAEEKELEEPKAEGAKAEEKEAEEAKAEDVKEAAPAEVAEEKGDEVKAEAEPEAAEEKEEEEKKPAAKKKTAARKEENEGAEEKGEE